MDVLAHMLWTNYGARLGNRELKKKRKPLMSLAWATFWGVFPDLFAFGIPITLAIFAWAGNGFHKISYSYMDALPHELYNYSHSLVIWAVVFAIVWIACKRPRFALLGWALHILIDMPSHAGNFYLTPVFFPVSNWHFTHGVPWSNIWYMIINYSLLLIASLYFFSTYAKKKDTQ